LQLILLVIVEFFEGSAHNVEYLHELVHFVHDSVLHFSFILDIVAYVVSVSGTHGAYSHLVSDANQISHS
jgi:hypothetical protein